MELKQELKQLAQHRGAVKCGVANLTDVQDFVTAQGGQYLSEFPRAVVIGFPLLRGIVKSLNQQPSKQDLNSYDFHAYEVLNRKLDYLAYDLAAVIEQSSFNAYTIAASKQIDDRNFKGVFSHKLAVNLSGTGWIGKSCLAVTEDYGPRIRWATVMTDAPLEADGPVLEDGCRNCRVCKEACPVNALVGNHWDPQQSRQHLLDAAKCQEYREGLKHEIGVRTCGLCMSKCPKGGK